MLRQMLMLQCAIIFIQMMNHKCCGDLNNSLVKDVNNKYDVTAKSVMFIIKNISSNDIYVIGSESFFSRNFNDLTLPLRNHPKTLCNIERQYQINRDYPLTTVVILFLDKEFIDDLKKLWLKLRRNKMIVVTNDCMETRSIVELFALLWSTQILNFIILTECNDTVNVYTYFPFLNNQCRTFSEPNIIKLGLLYHDPSIEKIQFLPKYKHTEEGFSNINSPFFPEKIPLNFNRCPIKVLTGIWPPNVINLLSIDEPGIEAEFIRAVEKQLNCKILLFIDDARDMGLKFGLDEEPTGRLGLLKNEMYDLMFGAVPANINILKDFDATDCFLRNDLTFIVPTAGILPNSMILWTIIEKHTILLITIVGIVFMLSIIINFMDKFSHKADQPTSDRHLIMKIFATLLRSLIDPSTPILPENRIIKWVYGMWFASCLIISCYFTTTLTSFFTEPGHAEQIKSVEDIIDSKIPISIEEIYSPVFMFDPEFGNYFRSKNVKSTVAVGLKLASMGEAATFTDVLRARHISVQWVSCYGESSIHFIGGDNFFWNIMVTYKGSPIMERINEIMRRINQSGFWNFQMARYYNRRLIRTMIRQYLIVYNFQNGINNTESIKQFNTGFSDSLDFEAGNDTEKVLLETNENDIIRRFVRSDKTLVTWDHLETVFGLWCIGMGMGGFVFLSEIFIFRYMKLICVR